jgi:mannose-6-phosphate isomerase-like protein (cupin superfamily)
MIVRRKVPLASLHSLMGGRVAPWERIYFARIARSRAPAGSLGTLYIKINLIYLSVNGVRFRNAIILLPHLPTGARAFLHRHRSYEEAFYVLEGEFTYRLGEREVTASAGTCVFIPARVVHGFKSTGPGPARHLVIHAPVQALAMIEELSQASVEQIPEVLAKYDSEFIAMW